jgi:bisphosphoglycerate-independent phosphoglycerate mutase (AlkP superfamily)
VARWQKEQKETQGNLLEAISMDPVARARAIAARLAAAAIPQDSALGKRKSRWEVRPILERYGRMRREKRWVKKLTQCHAMMVVNLNRRMVRRAFAYTDDALGLNAADTLSFVGICS